MMATTRRSRIGAWCSVLCLCVLASAPARAELGREHGGGKRHGNGNGVDRVPEDFPTLQEAIDLGSAATIQVASGEYAGAVVDRSVALVCKGQCMITTGVPVSSSEAGLVLTSRSDGSQIRGFDFVDLDLGVYASCETLGAAPDGVSVERNAFVNTAQGVTVNGTDCDGGNDWVIERNRFHDLRSDISNCGGGLGVYLISVEGGLVSRNVFRGEIAAPRAARCSPPPAST